MTEWNHHEDLQESNRQENEEAEDRWSIYCGAALLPLAVTALKGQGPSSDQSCLLQWILTQPSSWKILLSTLKHVDQSSYAGKTTYPYKVVHIKAMWKDAKHTLWSIKIELNRSFPQIVVYFHTFSASIRYLLDVNWGSTTTETINLKVISLTFLTNSNSPAWRIHCPSGFLVIVTCTNTNDKEIQPLFCSLWIIFHRLGSWFLEMSFSL